MIDWEDYFEPWILEQGYEYYEAGRVGKVTVKDNVILATVTGSKQYQVEIELPKTKLELDDVEDDDLFEQLQAQLEVETEVFLFSCECPYAKEKPCKHMAALLSKYEAQLLKPFPDIPTAKKVAKLPPADDALLVRLLEDADEFTLRAFLNQELGNDPKLAERFVQFMAPAAEDMPAEFYKNQIDDVIMTYQATSGSIDYERAADFSDEFAGMIQSLLTVLVEYDEFELAFSILKYSEKQVTKLDIDDSSGGMVSITDAWREGFEQVRGKANVVLKRKMFTWLAKKIEQDHWDYFTNMFEQLLPTFTETEFLEKRLKFAEKMVEKYADDESNNYRFGIYTIELFRLLSVLKKDPQEIEALYQKYWSNKEVRQVYIDAQVEKKDYQKAIEVIKDSIQLDDDYEGIVQYHHVQLSELYQLVDDQAAYQTELIWLVLQALLTNAERLKFFTKLKATYSKAEWVKQREILFDRLEKISGADVIYQAEKEYDRLLAYVVKAPYLYTVNNHLKVLKERYPQELRAKFVQEITEITAQANDRRTYQQVARWLTALQQIPGGRLKSNELIDQLIAKYPQRKAMIEEFEKVRV